MRHLLCISLLFLLVAVSAVGQTNKLIKDLEGKRGDLQKQIAESEALLKTANKNVNSQLNGLNVLTGQIKERKRYIETISSDILAVDGEMVKVDKRLSELQTELAARRKNYEASVKYLYKNRTIQEKLMFIFSADNLSQIYRRLRYVREYADYQRLLGLEIQRKQEQIKAKRTELNDVRNEKTKLLSEREAETSRLETQEKEQQKIIDGLKSKQRNLQTELAKQRREANQLNAKIDKLIAEEIEKARKRAEEEAKAERIAASRKQGTADKNAQTQTNNRQSNSSSSSGGTYTMSKADRQLSGDFASNRGRLPMPITGPYIIVSHFGQYSVQGLRNVTLDNKGINIQTKPGASARAVFSGKVAAVFKLNGLFNVLVRHGAYISVYCNLASTSVKQGDSVETKQPLGPVYSDSSDGGRSILHFQLRKETEKLNPEVWLNK